MFESTKNYFLYLNSFLWSFFLNIFTTKKIFFYDIPSKTIPKKWYDNDFIKMVLEIECSTTILKIKCPKTRNKIKYSKIFFKPCLKLVSTRRSTFSLYTLYSLTWCENSSPIELTSRPSTHRSLDPLPLKYT